MIKPFVFVTTHITLTAVSVVINIMIFCNVKILVLHDMDDISRHNSLYCDMIYAVIKFSCHDIEYDITQLYNMQYSL